MRQSDGRLEHIFQPLPMSGDALTIFWNADCATGTPSVYSAFPYLRSSIISFLFPFMQRICSFVCRAFVPISVCPKLLGSSLCHKFLNVDAPPFASLFFWFRQQLSLLTSDDCLNMPFFRPIIPLIYTLKHLISLIYVETPYSSER